MWYILEILEFVYMHTGIILLMDCKTTCRNSLWNTLWIYSLEHITCELISKTAQANDCRCLIQQSADKIGRLALSYELGFDYMCNCRQGCCVGWWMWTNVDSQMTIEPVRDPVR